MTNHIHKENMLLYMAARESLCSHIFVHHTAMIDASYEQTTSDKEIQGLEDEVFKLTMHQLHQLRDMRIVAERNGSYKTSLQTN